MGPISNSTVTDTLKAYGPALGSGAADKIRAYIAILLRWNQTISLTAVTNPTEILKFHFGESIFAASEVDFAKSRLADVGSGAGFPGLPLAIVVPGLEVTLIESNAKKCAFLSEVARELRLDNVSVFRGRTEDFRLESGKLDFVTARALGHHAELLEWTRTHLASSGRIVLWVGESDSREISLDLRWRWDAAKRIPGSERRFLLMGAPGD
jgi:16S rRNA (guanine527-N7)-methyltransferase